MTANDEAELDRLEAALLAAMDGPAANLIPDWETADDLSRISLEHMGCAANVGSAADSYEGAVRWAVRWAEEGQPSIIQDLGGDEDAARELYAHLTRRYTERNRTGKPELLTARIIWQRTE